MYNQLDSIYKSFRDIYLNIGKPSLKLRPFEPKQVPRSKQMNLTMKEIEDDLAIAYNEVNAIGNTFVEVFNYSHALSSDLLNATNSVGSKIVDLRFLNGQLDQNVLVAGDDFTNTSKIDTSFGLQNSPAEVSTIQGIVTLPRVESINVFDESTKIDVSPVAPSNLKVNPTVGNVGRFYEGNFYNFIGSARPEGGKFHLEESLSVTTAGTGVTTNVVIATQDSAHDVINGTLLKPIIDQAFAAPGPGQNLRPEDIIVYDRGASSDEKTNSRKHMADNNPSSFWECEYVKTDPNIQTYVDTSKLITPKNTDGSIGGEKDLLSSSVTLDDIRNKARATSASQEDDLVIDVTVTLSKPTQINWISINPNNFEDSAWIDVLDISYAIQDGSNFTTIPNFDNNIYDNVITNDANAELSDQTAGSILAPNKFSYKGIGVWSFEAVTAKVIKIRIRQRSAIPAPYQRLAIRLHRVFTQVFTHSSSDSGM